MKKLLIYLFPLTINDLIQEHLQHVDQVLDDERTYNRELLKKNVSLQRKNNELEAKILTLNKKPHEFLQEEKRATRDTYC